MHTKKNLADAMPCFYAINNAPVHSPVYFMERKSEGVASVSSRMNPLETTRQLCRGACLLDPVCAHVLCHCVAQWLQPFAAYC